MSCPCLCRHKPPVGACRRATRETKDSRKKNLTRGADVSRRRHCVVSLCRCRQIDTGTYVFPNVDAYMYADADTDRYTRIARYIQITKPQIRVNYPIAFHQVG